MRYALICLGLIACTDKETDNTPEPTDFTDEDDDGHIAGADCDDADATVFPGADELCDGIDNDCDGETDESPSNGTVAWADSDGDGFGDGDTRTDTCAVPAGWVEVGGDCDDANSAIHPDADELCDGVDNNCDAKVDNDPVDTTTFYIDADLDGYGSDETTVQSCDMPVGYSANDDDCNDSNPRTSPGAEELSCDNIDNNCDGSTDLNLVPRDHDSIQAAVDALEDGSEICLSSDTYADQLDLTGRTLTITGQQGPRSTRFDMGTAWPMVTVGAGGNITFQKISLQGPELLLADTNVQGGFARVEDATLALHDMQIDDAVVSVADDALLEGLLAYGENADISISGLTIDAASFTYDAGTGTSESVIAGGMLAVYDSTLDLFDVEMTGTTLSSSVESPEDCITVGLMALSEDSTVTGSYVDFNNMVYDLSCNDDILMLGLVLASFDSNEDLSSVSITDNMVSISDAESVELIGLTYVSDYSIGGTHHWSVVDVSNNTISTSSTVDGSFMLGAASFEADLQLDHFTAYGNDARLDATTSGVVLGGALFVAGSGSLSHIDLRANTAYATEYAAGGGAYLSTSGSSSAALLLSNLIAAANTVEAGEEAQGAGVLLENYDGGIVLTNADFVSNAATSADICTGGAISYEYGGDNSLTATNVNFSGNSCTATGTTPAEGQAAYLPGADDTVTYLWTYNNLFDQPTDAIAGFADPTGSDGNLSEEPKYISSTGSNAANWDLRLSVRSDLIDMGDPSILDADGTVSDIGAYGGPAGDDW
jgi:hypothetical protein